jgi:single-stranded-DNA-specific exonuclease
MIQDEFVKHVQICGAEFNRSKQPVVLFHHNDSDGISSAAILTAAFERAGISFRRYCLEKPYPQVVTQILNLHKNEKPRVVVADFGSGMLDEWARHAEAYQKLFILDHHSVVGNTYPQMEVINPIQYQLLGLPDCTASAVCFLFALGMHADNIDLAQLALLGFVGDRAYDSENALSGVNELVRSLVGLTFDRNAKESAWGAWSVQKIVECIDTLGSIAYFRGGPDVALKGAREFNGPALVHFAEKYDQELITLKNQPPALEFERGLYFFSLIQGAQPIGVKTVGLMCEHLVATRPQLESSYLAGFQIVPNQIPGLGPINLNQIKISMRVGPELRKQINTNQASSLADLLPAATKEVGGFVDACHPFAAATTIPLDAKEAFIKALTRRISSKGA